MFTFSFYTLKKSYIYDDMSQNFSENQNPTRIYR